MSTNNDETTVNEFATTKFIARATVLALVVLAGLLFSLIFLFNRPPAVDASVPACERPEVQAEEIEGRIQVESYQTYGITQLPVTPYGPSTTTPGPTCYEHSPAGAAAAAAGITTLVTSGSTDVALDHLALDTRAAHDMRADVAEAGIPEVIPQLVAARLDHYDGDTAEIRVAIEAPGDGIGRPRVGVDIKLVWEDGWKWDVPRVVPNQEQVYTLNGYTPFETPEEANTNG